MHATFPAHLIHLHLITVTIHGEQYTLLNPSSRSFVHPPVTSTLLGLNKLLINLFANTLHCAFLYLNLHLLTYLLPYYSYLLYVLTYLFTCLLT